MNKKIIIILTIIILVIVGFITLLATYTSTLSEAKKEIKNSKSNEDIIAVWNKYESDLNDKNTAILINEISKKATELDLDEDELDELTELLPKGERNMNVIIVPDLSRRIIDEVNNPNQIENDQIIIETIWKEFAKISKFKKKSNDYFSINVTDLDQAKGNFSTLANNLRLDLSEKEKNKPNRVLFNDSLNNLITKNVKNLYELAKEKPLGADYKFYFRRYLPNQLKKSDFQNYYSNKLIIITDGYLEAENQQVDTKIKGYEKELKLAVENGTIEHKIKQLGLEIPKLNIDLSTTDVLICEVNERKNGKGYHFEILQAYWKLWLESMNAKSITFINREQATKQTQTQIKKYLKK